VILPHPCLVVEQEAPLATQLHDHY
jgi:hypothetical protein